MKASSQTAVPCLLMRGGTSKGPFYKASDLPSDIALRDKVLLAAMGSPDKRQIDGLGGAHPLTSKVGIVSQSTVPGVALDFLFAQLQPDKDTVDTTPNCGNMLAAVVPFALEACPFPRRRAPRQPTCCRSWAWYPPCHWQVEVVQIRSQALRRALYFVSRCPLCWSVGAHHPSHRFGVCLANPLPPTTLCL